MNIRCQLHIWSSDYYVYTVGAYEVIVRNYIKNQEKEDKRLEQLKMFKTV